MSSAFDSDFATAESLLDEVFGGLVTLRRGVQATQGFVAAWTLQEYEVIDQEGGLTVVQSRDYSVPKASVVLGGAVVQPRAGDRIVDGSDLWEIVPLAPRPAVEDTPGGTRWLVHTKKVAK